MTGTGLFGKALNEHQAVNWSLALSSDGLECMYTDRAPLTTREID